MPPQKPRTNAATKKEAKKSTKRAKPEGKDPKTLTGSEYGAAKGATLLEQTPPGQPPPTGAHGNKIVFPPETLANLAVQLLGLKPEQIKVLLSNGKALSDPLLDRHFLDALKRAESILNTAAGQTDEEVHAYQLFNEGAEPMSFDDITERFKEVGWTKACSRNKVEEYVEMLVNDADCLIDGKLEYYRQLAGRKIGVPVSFENIEYRVGSYVLELISSAYLSDFIPNPWIFSERIAKYFIHLISMHVPLQDDESPMEQHESVVGYSSFPEYVCGGLSFAKFMGLSEYFVGLDLDRLETIAFFFENLASAEEIPHDAFNDLEKLQILTNKGGVFPFDIVQAIKVCSAHLISDPCEIGSVNQCAKDIAQSLRTFHRQWYFESLESLQEFSGGVQFSVNLLEARRAG